MCFTPAISLATALIEFLVAGYLFKRINKKELRFLPYIILLLGVYQLTEFFLCTTNNQFWAKLGFITYTFLPIIAAHLLYDLAKIKFNKLFYLIPIFYSLIALFYSGFSIIGNCQSFYIDIRNIYLWENFQHLWIYTLYYGLLPLRGAYLYLKHQNPLRNNSKWKLRISLILVPLALTFSEAISLLTMMYRNGYQTNWIITSLMIIIISIILIGLSFTRIKAKTFNALLLLILFSSVFMSYAIYQVFPGFGLTFPSIFCQFALLYSISAILFTEHYQSNNI